jgi:hypothetical protein
MSRPLTASQVLENERLTIRSRLIDVAAALDRIDRAEGSVAGDPTIEKIRRSLEILGSDAPGKAEQIQMAFSLPYKENWQQEYGVKT